MNARTITAQLNALNALEVFTGKRPEITADIKKLQELRRNLKAEEKQEDEQDDTRDVEEGEAR